MLQLQTFGGLELRTEGGERVEALAGRTKVLALLAYVAAEAPGGRVPREEAAALLWPGRTDDRARNSLRVALSRVRRATEDPLLHGDGAPSLGLARDHLRADVTAFQKALEAGDLARALDLYRGDFLAGIRVEGARRFQRWADERRGQFRRRAYEAALSLGDSAREADELAEAEERFRTALDLAPLREEAAGELIRTLAERGRVADAVQLHEAFRARRREELELDPSPELDRLVEELKAAPAPAASGGDAPAGSGGDAPGGFDGDAAATRGDDPAGGPPGPGAAGETARGERVDEEAGRGGPASHLARPGRLLGGFLVLSLLASALFSAWHFLDPGSAATPPAGDRSVAVLPFEAIGEGEAGVLAEGMHADLLTRLANVSGLDVVAQTSVEQYRDAGTTTAEIARELGVRWVLEGGVQKSGDQAQVNAQLIDPRTDTHVWAETYRRGLTAESLFALQGDISREIASVLEARLAGGEEERLYRQTTGSLDAHRFYVRGRSLLEQRKPPQMRRALDYFGQALREDSSYALAWAGMADALSILARYPDGDPDTLLPSAAEAVDRALALEPDLAEARAARGRLHMYRREGPAALRTFQRAVELKPSHATAHAWLGKLLLSLGRPGAALSSARRSVELDPMSVENQGTLCLALLAEGRYEEALDVARDIDELARGAPRYLNSVFAHLGRSDELKRLARERERLEPGSLAYWFFLAVSGDTAAAPRVLAETDGSRTPVVAAIAHSLAGRQDRAFELMEDAYPRAERPWDIPFTVWLRYFWPETLAELRDDPRYDRLVREMNTHWGLEPDGSLPSGEDVTRIAG